MSGWIVLGILVVLVLLAFGAYNRLVALSQRVNQAFADIDVQLKQRHDLIPNLVETVKGYAAHERGTLDEVIKARNAAMSAQGPGPGLGRGKPALRRARPADSRCPRPIRTSRPTPTSSSCRANCPTSKTRSPPARRFFNNAVQEYNTGIQQMPGSAVRRHVRLHPQGFLRPRRRQRPKSRRRRR